MVSLVGNLLNVNVFDNNLCFIIKYGWNVLSETSQAENVDPSP